MSILDPQSQCNLRAILPILLAYFDDCGVIRELTQVFAKVVGLVLVVQGGK